MISMRVERPGRPDFVGLGLTAEDLIRLTDGRDLTFPGEPFGFPGVEFCLHFSPTTETLIAEITRNDSDMAGKLTSAMEQVEASGGIRVVQPWNEKREVQP